MVGFLATLLVLMVGATLFYRRRWHRTADELRRCQAALLRLHAYHDELAKITAARSEPPRPLFEPVDDNPEANGTH
jgi:hypothetical protein